MLEITTPGDKVDCAVGADWPDAGAVIIDAGLTVATNVPSGVTFGNVRVSTGLVTIRGTQYEIGRAVIFDIHVAQSLTPLPITGFIYLDMRTSNGERLRWYVDLKIVDYLPTE